MFYYDLIEHQLGYLLTTTKIYYYLLESSAQTTSIIHYPIIIIIPGDCYLLSYVLFSFHAWKGCPLAAARTFSNYQFTKKIS